MEIFTGVNVVNGYRGHTLEPAQDLDLAADPPQGSHPARDEPRAAIEPIMAHVKAEHRMNRNDLKHPVGDPINAATSHSSYPDTCS
ncbi:hypothetical protein [Bradyrhizobium sp. ORS 86]|uniref:hypothetical protein n=1 Tax=Bradyrhizobium sp. ORS 86 TaxID=1685970 RepID=UPI00388F0C9E